MMQCRVIDCNAKSYTGQEGYCSKHYDELVRIREENKKAEELPEVQDLDEGD